MKIFRKISLRIQQVFTEGPVREGGRNPFVDWSMILMASIVVAVILVSNGVYLFKRVTSGDIQSKTLPVQKNIEILDVESLDYVIGKFNTKADLSNNVKKGYQSVPDPSI